MELVEADVRNEARMKAALEGEDRAGVEGELRDTVAALDDLH